MNRPSIIFAQRETGKMSEVSLVLRPGGKFVGHTVGGNHYVTWVRRVVGLLPHSFNQYLVKALYGRPEIDTFPTFYRLNTERAIEEMGRKTGLDSIYSERYADPITFLF